MVNTNTNTTDKTPYAYLHAIPGTTDASGVYYVGKGDLKRSRQVTRNRARYPNLAQLAVVQAHGAENILVGRLACSTDAAAFELEAGLIKCLSRMGAPLCNKGAGGAKSAVGVIRTAAHKAAISAAQKGKTMSDAQRAQVSAVHKGKTISDAHKAAISAVNKGKKLSDAHKAALLATHKGRKHTQEAMEKMRASAAKRREHRTKLEQETQTP